MHTRGEKRKVAKPQDEEGQLSAQVMPPLSNFAEFWDLIVRLEVFANASAFNVFEAEQYVETFNSDRLLSSKRSIQAVDKMIHTDWIKFAEKITIRVDADALSQDQALSILQQIVAASLDSVPSDLRMEADLIAKEEELFSKPNISLFAGVDTSSTINRLMIPIECRSSLIDATFSALSHLAYRLRAQLELVDPRTIDLSGYCVGCDGTRIVIGYIEIKNMQLYVCHTSMRGMSLWPKGEAIPKTETDGVTVLRSLFSASLHQLGQQTHTHVVSDRYQLVDVLGRGKSCWAFVARDLRASAGEDSESAVQVQCMLKQPGAREQGAVQLARWQHECSVLRAFTHAALQNVPHLHDIVHEVTSTTPYLILTPIGMSLLQYAHGQTPQQREANAQIMYTACASALAAAVTLGYCHSNLAPANIIVSSNNTYTIIDWGLARPPGAPMHHNTRHLYFMADPLVEYFYRMDGQCLNENQPAIAPEPYLPEYDTLALQFVQYDYSRGHADLVTPWHYDIGASMNHTRAGCMAAGPFAMAELRWK